MRYLHACCTIWAVTFTDPAVNPLTFSESVDYTLIEILNASITCAGILHLSVFGDFK